MATRKKKPEELADGSVTTVTETPPGHTVTPDPPSNGQPDGTQKPKPNRPAASFAAYSDRTTRIEVAVWSKLVKVSEQEEYTQYTLTLARSWQKDGHWQGNAAFRIHDLPVLLYLAQQAYNWCLAQRTEVRIEATGDVPF